MHTHTPQGEKFPKKSHPGGVAARGDRKIFFGHTQCVHTPLVPKPMPTYDDHALNNLKTLHVLEMFEVLIPKLQNIQI